MLKCPHCQFENEDGALFCEQCKGDLGSAEQTTASVSTAAAVNSSAAGADTPNSAVSEVASPLVAVAFGEVAVTEAVPIAQVDAGAAATAGVPIAVAVPLSETPPVVVSSEPSPAGIALAEAAPRWEAAPAEYAPAAGASAPAAPTAPDLASPITGTHPDAAAIPGGAEAAERLPAGAKPKLVVLRGQRVNVEYPLYEGDNYLGRADEKAVDIDLEDQEPPERIWSSRQHALITFEDGRLTIEDLNSTNGTFVNRLRIHPGQKRPLRVNDVLQIGTVQMKVTI